MKCFGKKPATSVLCLAAILCELWFLHSGHCSPKETESKEFAKDILAGIVLDRGPQLADASKLFVEYEVAGSTKDHPDGIQAQFRFVFKACNGMWIARHFIKKGDEESLAFEEAFDGSKFFASSRSHLKKRTLLVSQKSFPSGPLPLSSPYMNIPLQAFSFLTFSERGVVPSSVKSPNFVELTSAGGWRDFLDVAETISADANQLILQVSNNDVGGSPNTFTRVSFNQHGDSVRISRLTKFRDSAGAKAYEVIVDEHFAEEIGGMSMPKTIKFFSYRSKTGSPIAYEGNAEIRNLVISKDRECTRADFQLNLVDYEQIIDLDNRLEIPVPNDQ